jgi:hypothetical protein
MLRRIMPSGSARTSDALTALISHPCEEPSAYPARLVASAP